MRIPSLRRTLFPVHGYSVVRSEYSIRRVQALRDYRRWTIGRSGEQRNSRCALVNWWPGTTLEIGSSAFRAAIAVDGAASGLVDHVIRGRDNDKPQSPAGIPMTWTQK